MYPYRVTRVACEPACVNTSVLRQRLVHATNLGLLYATYIPIHYSM